MSSDMNQGFEQPDLFSDAAPSADSADWLNEFYGVTADLDLVDGLARYQGIDPRYSYIVQAPAGSGKTSLLTQRYLALLAQVDSPEQIVAMTFTKKAAAEMRERVVEALQKAAKPLGNDALLVEINSWNLAQKALQQDKLNGWNLMQNPNRLRIKTIDGINSFLVAQMPLLSKIGGQPQVVDDASEAYLQAVRQTLKMPELEEPVGRLLRLVNGRFNRAENLLISMLAKRDQWMRTLIQFQGDEAREFLQAAIKEIVCKEFEQNRQALFYLSDIFSQACQLADFAQHNDQPQLAIIAGFWPFNSDISSLQQWRVLADWLLTKQNEIRKPKGVTKSIGFPAGKGENKDNKDRFIELLETLQNAANSDANILDCLVALKALPDADYSDQQWQDLQGLIQLLTYSVANLKTVFQSQAQADYIEIAQAASMALGNELEPTDLAQKLDYQIQHLLVDEFQDTSSEQYRLLTKLIAGWQPDDGRSLFLVGDPMQSIYRFREAEVGNFLKAWQGKLGEVELKPLNLQVNFRSNAGVVNWVNQAFSQVLPQEDEIEKGAVSYTKATAFSTDDQLAVKCHWALNRNAESEAQQVAELIQQRLREIDCETDDNKKTVAVLGRSRSHLAGIALNLKQQGISFRAVELENLAERQEVQDLLALSRALLHLADREAWIALLRSPLVGLNLPDLTELIAERPYQTVWSSIEPFLDRETKACRFEDNPKFTSDAIARLNRSIPILQKALQRFGGVPLASLLRETWLNLDGPLTVENELALENVEVYLHSLAELESSANGLGSLNQQLLQKQMDKLYARPDSSKQSQQIELMTMHKSKGLEFDTVILPGLGRRPRVDDSELVSWFQFMSDSGEEQLVIAPLDQKGREESRLRQLLKGFENQKQNFELGRLLYVAATRAKSKLHLFADIKFKPKEDELELGSYQLNPEKGSLLESLWPVAKAEFLELTKAYQIEEVSAEELEVCWPKISRLPLQRNGFAELSFNPAFDIDPLSESTSEDPVKLSAKTSSESENSIEFDNNALLSTEVGTLVHAIFEQMVEEGIENWNQAILESRLPIYQQWLEQAGLSKSQLDLAIKRVGRSIVNALQNDRVRWALANNQQQSECELALTSEEDGVIANHIVDRTFIDDQGVRWIIDYKTSVYDDKDIDGFIAQQIENYRPQLERYGRLFAQIEDLPQKWVLYFSYLDKWVEL